MDERLKIYNSIAETMRNSIPDFEPFLYAKYLLLCDKLNSDLKEARETSDNTDFLLEWIEKNEIDEVCEDNTGKMMYPHLIIVMMMGTAKAK